MSWGARKPNEIAPAFTCRLIAFANQPGWTDREGSPSKGPCHPYMRLQACVEEGDTHINLIAHVGTGGLHEGRVASGSQRANNLGRGPRVEAAEAAGGAAW